MLQIYPPEADIPAPLQACAHLDRQPWKQQCSYCHCIQEMHSHAANSKGTYKIAAFIQYLLTQKMPGVTLVESRHGE